MWILEPGSTGPTQKAKELGFLTNQTKTEKATSTAAKINAAGADRALAVVGDILDDSYIATLVQRAAEFGNGKIHIIVNNAGFTWDGVIHKVCPLGCILHVGEGRL